MNILEKINFELKKSIKNKDREKSSFLRTIKGEFDRIGKNIDENKMISILKTMLDNAKQLSNNFEIEILEYLLPTMLNEEQIEEEINIIIKDNNFTNIKELGSLMKIMKEKYGSKYDGKIASTIGKNKLGFNSININNGK